MAARNKEPEFTTVLPEPYVPATTETEAVDRVLAYLDGFGVLSFELKFIRDTLLEGRAE